MKKLLFLFSLFLFSFSLHAQIENVIVETYYVSDSLDATDTTDGRVLEAGSKTYRIYVDLTTGSKITKIYGDPNHKLILSSTANFFNNINRPNAYFGYLINKAWFPGNPTIALDSWLSLGLATKTQNGILKSEDTDGSILGGTNNGGGSSGISGGILTNNASAAGIPLTTADGLALNTTVLSQWSDFGFRDMAGVDTSIFGSVNTGSRFESDSVVYLQQISGVSGANADSNKVLVAQLTTKGDISFELNLEVQNSDGTKTNYVANDSILLSGEVVSPFLKYPPACGCMDPNFLEFKKSYSCALSGSCMTRIVFGCTDTLACNYNPNANFNVKYLCCYPGLCNDRDLDIVCPQTNGERWAGEHKLIVRPNPADEKISFEIAAVSKGEAKYVIYNSFGKVVVEKSLGTETGIVTADVSHLELGLYFLRLFINDEVLSERFLKN